MEFGWVFNVVFVIIVGVVIIDKNFIIRKSDSDGMIYVGDSGSGEFFKMFVYWFVWSV